MNPVKNLVKNEPVVSAAVITGIVGALLRLLIAFGIDITSDQVEAILDVVTLLAPIVGALVARRFVSPVRGKRARRAGDPDASE